MKHKFMKKGIVLLLALSMVLAFTGCKGKEKEPEKTKMSEEDKNTVYQYNVLNLNNESSDFDNVQFENNKIYATMYEYSEDTGVTTEYLITLDMEGNEIGRIIIPSGWNDNGGYGMNQICVANDGTIYGVSYSYENYYDETAGEYIWREEYSLVQLDEEGNEVWSVPLGGTEDQGIDESNYYYVNRLLVDNNDTIWVFDTKNYTAYDTEGNKGMSVKALENSSGVYLTQDGNFVVGSWGTDYDQLKFYLFDTQKGVIEDEAYEVPGNYYQYSYYSGVGSGYDMFATNSVGIWAFNWGDTEMVKIMDYILSDFESSGLYNVCPTDEGQFMASFYDLDWKMQIASFTKVPPEEVADKYIMKLACHYLADDVKKQVIEFNRAHEDVRITIEDYSAYIEEDNYEAGIEKMNSDILAGNIPDIMVAPSDMDLSIYANKGLFADLYEFIEKDEVIQTEDYLENILALGEYEGKLYELIPQFNAITLIGKTSDVGEGYGWSYDEVNALMKQKGEGVSLFPEDTVRSNVMYYGVNMAFKQFYDSNTGECNFDSPAFIQYLELLNQYPDEQPEDLWAQDDYWISYDNQWREGRSILRYGWIYDFQSYVEYSQGYFGEQVSYIGFPTADGSSGSSASVDFTLAIGEESAFKEEAWEFVSYFLSDDYQDNLEGCFPVKLSSLDKKAQKAREPFTWVSEETGEVIEEENYFWIGEEEIILSEPTEEECQYVINFLKNIHYRQREITDIVAIIEEESASYFAGEKTAQAAAEIIQSRVKIYVSEKR